jgi:hypothetical protein
MSTNDAAKIQQERGKLWLNVNVPASGKRLRIDARGRPLDGSPVFVGTTEGAPTILVTPKLERVLADQAVGPIDVVMTGEAAVIEVTLKESDLTKLRQLLFARLRDLFVHGTISKRSIAVIFPRRDAAGKFVVCQLYRAYLAEAVPLRFQRGKETAYRVKFVAVPDLSRPAGDQIGNMYRQT